MFKCADPNVSWHSKKNGVVAGEIFQSYQPKKLQFFWQWVFFSLFQASNYSVLPEHYHVVLQPLGHSNSTQSREIHD